MNKLKNTASESHIHDNKIKKFYLISPNILELDDWYFFIKITHHNWERFIFRRNEQILGEYDKIGSLITLKSWDKIFYARDWVNAMFVRYKNWSEIWWKFLEVWQIQDGNNEDEVFFTKTPVSQAYYSFLSRLPIWWEFDKVWQIQCLENWRKLFYAEKKCKKMYVDLKLLWPVWWEFDVIWNIKFIDWIYCFAWKVGDKMMYINIETWKPIWWEFDKVWKIHLNQKTKKHYFEAYLWKKKLKIDLVSWEKLTDFGTKILGILNKKII